MGGYWHIFRLGPENWPVIGENTVEVTLLKLDHNIVEDQLFDTLRDVELEIKYLMGRSFFRGEGNGMVDPDLGPYDSS